MRILHVSPFFLPVEGGLERHVYHVSLELLNRGHEVVVFTSNIDRKGRKLPLHETLDGIEVRRFPVWLRIGEFGTFWPTFMKHVKDFDVVHLHNYRHPHALLGALVAKYRRIPNILTTHAPFHPPGSRKNN